MSTSPRPAPLKEPAEVSALHAYLLQQGSPLVSRCSTRPLVDDAYEDRIIAGLATAMLHDANILDTLRLRTLRHDPAIHCKLGGKQHDGQEQQQIGQLPTVHDFPLDALEPAARPQGSYQNLARRLVSEQQRPGPAATHRPKARRRAHRPASEQRQVRADWDCLCHVAY